MKRIVTATAVALTLAGLAFAQPYGGGGYGPMMGGPNGAQAPNGAVQAAPQAKTIEGKLVFVDKIPAVQTKDKTYLIRMPGFFQDAYFDGIKEGAAVKLDGYELPALPGQDKPWFFATKAVINGKTYDNTTQGYGRMGGFGGGHPGMMGGFGGMMGGRRGGRW